MHGSRMVDANQRTWLARCTQQATPYSNGTHLQYDQHLARSPIRWDYAQPSTAQHSTAQHSIAQRLLIRAQPLEATAAALPLTLALAQCCTYPRGRAHSGVVSDRWC